MRTNRMILIAASCSALVLAARGSAAALQRRSPLTCGGRTPLQIQGKATIVTDDTPPRSVSDAKIWFLYRVTGTTANQIVTARTDPSGSAVFNATVCDSIEETRIWVDETIGIFLAGGSQSRLVNTNTSLISRPTVLMDIDPNPGGSERRYRLALGVISGPIFPSRTKPSVNMKPEILDQWLRAAARAGELPPLDGSGFRWHALRRKWATERKHLPLPDVMAAGGWKDSATLLTAYQHADDQTMLKVMAHPNKLVRVGSTPSTMVTRNDTRNGTTWNKTREPDNA